MKISGFKAFAPLPLASWLRLTGPDAFPFLQGQFSRDLRGLGAGEARYGLWLDHKGRICADGYVVKESLDGFYIVSDLVPASVLKDRFEHYIIADDVALEDQTQDWDRRVLVGDGDDGGQAGVGEGFVLSTRRGATPTRDWIFPRSLSDLVDEQLQGVARMGTADLERMMIEACIPAVPVDMGPGDLPQEGGLGESAVSYEKGCYLGQEVMARLKAKGRVRRTLCSVRGTGSLPLAGEPLFVGQARVGELRSAVADADGYRALALVLIPHAVPGATLARGQQAGEAVTVVRVG